MGEIPAALDPHKQFGRTHLYTTFLGSSVAVKALGAADE